MAADLKIREPISDAEFFRLEDAYRRRKDPMRRSPERVDRPIDIKPSVAGARIVTWPQYLELVSRKEAQYPPKAWGSKL